MSPTLAGGFLITAPPGEPSKVIYYHKTMSFQRAGSACLGGFWSPRTQHKAGHRVICFEDGRKGGRAGGRKENKMITVCEKGNEVRDWMP